MEAVAETSVIRICLTWVRAVGSSTTSAPVAQRDGVSVGSGPRNELPRVAWRFGNRDRNAPPTRMGSLAHVSPIALRARLRRWRHHAAVLALLFAVVAVVAIHHAAPAMGAEHHDADMVAAAEMCLGVFTAVGAAIMAVALALIALGRWRPAIVISPYGVLWAGSPPQPRIRAGPALLVLLCVSRR